MKFKHLEALRGLAAFLVFINHIQGSLPYFEKHQNLFLRAFCAWGSESVIVFFILSGVVIHHVSVKSLDTPALFLKKRLVRLLPIYFIALLLVELIYWIVEHRWDESNSIIGSVFFVATLQGLLTRPLTFNPVIWSLSFEMFFYVVYTLTIGKNQQYLLKWWFGVSLVAIGFSYFKTDIILVDYLVLMFSFSSLWLVGYFFYGQRDKIKVNLPLAVFAASMVPSLSRLQISSNYYDPTIYLISTLMWMPLFIVALKSVDDSKRIYLLKLNHFHYLPLYIILLFISFKFSKSLMVTKVTYNILPCLALLLLIPQFCKFTVALLLSVEKYFIFIGTISYALYLVHKPFIHLLSHYYPNSLFADLVFIIALSFGTSIFLEFWFQPRIRNFFFKSYMKPRAI